MKFVITVPHATCPANADDETHNCDTLAKEFANSLKKEITCAGVEVYVGDVPRTACDLNRKECRNLAFRKQVAKAIKKDTIVLDAHSYPVKGNDYSPFEVFLIGNTELRGKIGDRLEKAGYKVGQKDSPPVNDILEQSREIGSDAVLVEVNESLKTGRLKDISREIAGVLCEMS